MDVLTLQRIEENSSNQYRAGINFSEIPIDALSSETRRHLSNLLNKTKYLLSEEGDFRDWRGVMTRIPIPSNMYNSIAQHEDSMGVLLRIWEQETDIKMKNIKRFQFILGLIDRWDVIDDANDSFMKDAELFLTQKVRNENLTIQQQSQQGSHNYSSNDISNDEVIVKDDIITLKLGLPKVTFDAFVLFADEDLPFAQDLLERIESKGYKLCMKDRDLVAGIQFQHEAIMHLISERCNRLIIIVSPAFLRSQANKFFVNYAQALGIEQGRNKIIPCLIENCTLPNTLKFYFILNFQRSGILYNFWDKLVESLERATLAGYGNNNSRLQQSYQRLPAITITTSQDEQMLKRIEFDKQNYKQKIEMYKVKDRAVIEEINSSVQIYSNHKQNIGINSSPIISVPNTSEVKINEVINNLPTPPLTPPRSKIKSQSLWDLQSHSNQSFTIDASRSSENIQNNDSINLSPSIENPKVIKKSSTTSEMHSKSFRFFDWIKQINSKSSSILLNDGSNNNNNKQKSDGGKIKSKKKNHFLIKKKKAVALEC